MGLLCVRHVLGMDCNGRSLTGPLMGPLDSDSCPRRLAHMGEAFSLFTSSLLLLIKGLLSFFPPGALLGPLTVSGGMESPLNAFTLRTHTGECVSSPSPAPLMGPDNWSGAGSSCSSSTCLFSLNGPESKILGRGETTHIPGSGHGSDQSLAAMKGLVIKTLDLPGCPLSAFRQPLVAGPPLGTPVPASFTLHNSPKKEAVTVPSYR